MAFYNNQGPILSTPGLRRSESQESRVDLPDKVTAPRLLDIAHRIPVLFLLEPAVQDIGELYLVADRREELQILPPLIVAGLELLVDGPRGYLVFDLNDVGRLIAVVKEDVIRQQLLGKNPVVVDSLPA